MLTIAEFNDRLQEEFSGRLRLRASEVRDTTLYLEERTDRGTLTMVADLRDKSTLQTRRRVDERIRARDGYSKVMEVQTGTRSACTRCGTPYRVPMLASGEVRCSGCDAVTITAFFPLGEVLLDYLRARDPLRVDQSRRVRDESARAEWLKACEERSLRNDVGEGFRDSLIEQIPAARYSGRTAFWE